MRDRRDPWKWPICVGLTVAMVLTTVFLLPQSWINAFFSPLSLVERLQREKPVAWMVILSEPPVVMVPDDQQETDLTPPEPVRRQDHLDPDWWARGWRIRTVNRETAASQQAVEDSVAVLLAALGVERDFMRRARPDSVLAARLFMLRVEDSFKFEEMKPYLSAMTRSRDYADIMSRKADMYDEFLSRSIMTPD